MITTRIQYSRVDSNLVSKPVIAYDGALIECIIERSQTRNFTITLIEKNTLSILDVITEISSEQKAKKLARGLLINKYNVRLIEELRGN